MITHGKKGEKNIYKYLVITHTFTTGPAQELRDYFINGGEKFAFIEHPFSYNDHEKHSKITFFSEGKPQKKIFGAKGRGPEIFYFIKDFFFTLYFVLRSGKKFKICLAADNLNALAALLLKRIGRIEKLVYWSIDYTPKRFDNKILNSIYHWIDRLLCYKSDLIWNSSSRMMEARKNNKVSLKKCASEVIVVDGCHFDDMKRNEDNDRFKLVFMGNLFKNKGVDLILSALPELVQKFPALNFTVVGKGPELENLKSLARELKIEDKVRFTGFVEKHADLESIIAGCGIALAPYVPDPNSYSFFSDVGKVKVYLASGLPVLLTDVPEIARIIENKKAGLIFSYDQADLKDKLSVLLGNEGLYLNYRSNAIELAGQLDWKNIWQDVLEKTRTQLYEVKSQ